MSAIRDELHELLSSLADEELGQVRDFVRVLLEEPEELTEGELQDIGKGEEEVRQGEWVKWEDIRRKDV